MGLISDGIQLFKLGTLKIVKQWKKEMLGLISEVQIWLNELVAIIGGIGE